MSCQLEEGFYVEILPQNTVDEMMKRNGFPNNGIVVSVDDAIVEVWRDETAKLGLVKTTKVKRDQVVLIKGKDDGTEKTCVVK